MDDPLDLYRLATAAQARAEASGFAATAAALAAIAEMIALETRAHVDLRLVDPGPGPTSASGLPIYQEAQT